MTDYETLSALFLPGMSGILHHEEKRYLSENEIKVLSSFPENYILVGDFKQKWARIGNSVMPNMMCNLAKQIVKSVFE